MVKNMQKQLQQLVAFHKAFGHPYRESFERELPMDTILLRQSLMTEEVKEWTNDAIRQEPITMRAKELADIAVTLFGTVVAEGLQDVFEQVFDAVMVSNMSKLGRDGKPVLREDNKILKGPDYKVADLSFLNAINETV